MSAPRPTTQKATSMQKQAISPKSGPPAKGPYSPAIAFGDLVFVSGQGPVDATGKIVVGDVVEEMKVALDNVRVILEAAGSSFEQVLKVTLYLKDMNDFARVNEVYRQYFGPVFPARTTIQAGRLPFDIKIEIDVIAFREAAESAS
jgi:2-iminobutanoate/2-iminopropanoate deaminase